MTELQKRAKEYLTSKGVKSTGDKFIALEVMDLLCEFAQREQLNIGGVGNSKNDKKCSECKFCDLHENNTSSNNYFCKKNEYVINDIEQYFCNDYKEE